MACIKKLKYKIYRRWYYLCTCIGLVEVEEIPWYCWRICHCHHTYLTYKYLFPNCENMCEFEKESGFSNLYKHLKKHWSDHDIHTQIRNIRVKGGNTTKLSNFMMPENELNAIKFLKTIYVKNQYLFMVQDKDWNEFSNPRYTFSRKSFYRLIFKMTELVENKTKIELGKITCGSIMSDGWSRCGVHSV